MTSRFSVEDSKKLRPEPLIKTQSNFEETCMNQLLEHIYKTSQVEDCEGNFINPFPTATAYEIGEIFYELIQKEKLERTLEVGMAYGLSTLFICQAHYDQGTGSHTAIDPNQKRLWKSIGQLNIKRAGLEDKFRLFEAKSHEILPQLLDNKEQFDFAFIDGMHLFDYALVDFFYIDKMLSVGGYIAVDDIWMPSIRKLLYFILKNRTYELIKISTNQNATKRIKRIARRFFQYPLERDCQGVKFTPENFCLLKKISEDNRHWEFHSSF